LTEMDFLTVSVKMAQTFEATTIRGKRGTFITISLATRSKVSVCVASSSEAWCRRCKTFSLCHKK
jgi:hypothetical protein